MKRLICIIIFLIITLLIGMDTSYALDCIACHDDIIIAGAHKEKITCESCHKNIKEETHSSEGVENVSCESCHKDFVKAMQNNVHYRLRNRDDDSLPDCATCHGYHEIRRPAEIENKGEYYCSECHDNILLADNFHSKNFMPDKSCVQCHNETKDYKGELLSSMHKRFACVDCHPYVVNNFVKHTQNIGSGKSAECSLCHKKAALEYRESIHGISLKEGVDEAARCWNCHGSHEILSKKNENSNIYPSNLAKTCAVCHDDPELVKKYSISAKLPGKMYSQSVHGKLVEKGRMDAATCVLCHGVHNIKNVMQPDSKISSFNVPETCGSCHGKILSEYKDSIHWVYAKKGRKESPVCNDCHSEHSVYAINTVNKKDEIQKIQEETCFNCHQDPLIARRFSLTGQQAVQYKDSYHGLAAMRGGSEAALCIDCHGAHKILPEDDPESMINMVNRTETCKKCHTNATALFAKSYSHQTGSAASLKVEKFAENIYIYLIITVICGMLLHNLLIYVYEIQKRKRREKKVATLLRFNTNELIQHFMLIAAFVILSFTGFALKYPDLWLFKWMEPAGITETLRQYIHRSAGILLFVLGIYHVSYLVLTRKGRNLLADLFPKFNDITDSVNNVLYYLRIKKHKVPFFRFDYTEKLEYWALVWGTLIMAISGFVLWFPEKFSLWVPVIWFIKVNEIVHFYEAILATSAIFVWHWFFVVFHPAEYPMSFTWLSGRMPVESYKHHHKRYFDQLSKEWSDMKSGKLQFDQLSAGAKIVIADLHKNCYDPDIIFKPELDREKNSDK